MKEFLYSLPPRSFFINLGMAAAISVMVILIAAEYRRSRRTVVLWALSALCTAPSGIGGRLAGKIAYGEWSGIGEFIGGLFEYEGTHYIGNALYITQLAPVLWKAVMRKDKGVFDYHGLDRFMGILSVYALIQGFIGRIGCLSEGCCYGKACDGVLSTPVVGLDYTTYPAVWVELVITLAVFAAVAAAYVKRRGAAPIYCAGYGFAVFVSEFLYDQTGALNVSGLSAIQLCALALMLTGAVYTGILTDESSVNK